MTGHNGAGGVFGMNEKHGFFQKLGKALNGKGFYMVLLLCLMLLGASGFYLYRTVTAPSAPEQTASGQAEVTVTSPLPEEHGAELR